MLAATLAFAAIAPAWADRRDPLTLENSALLMVDYQPQFVFSVQSIAVRIAAPARTI